MNAPTFRDWRYNATARNGGSIVPNRPGQRFSADQLTELVGWLKANGLRPYDCSPSIVRVTGPTSQRLDLSAFGAAGVKAEARQARKEAQRQADKQAREDRKTLADSRLSAAWIVSTFGEDFANDYNRNALSDYLEGVTRRFEGLASRSWLDGVVKAGALTEDGADIDWTKLRQAFQRYHAVTSTLDALNNLGG